MKLKDWLDKFVSICGTNKGFTQAGLHVIGTCGKCKHWAAPPFLMCQLEKNWDDLRADNYPKHFGCIHWEKKE